MICIIYLCVLFIYDINTLESTMLCLILCTNNHFGNYSQENVANEGIANTLSFTIFVRFVVHIQIMVYPLSELIYGMFHNCNPGDT